MAILYGTQSNGETLPVLVDQFGNLLAKGIEGPAGSIGPEGPEGPEGPPGTGVPEPIGEEGQYLQVVDGEPAWADGPPDPNAPSVRLTNPELLTVQDATGQTITPNDPLAYCKSLPTWMSQSEQSLEGFHAPVTDQINDCPTLQLSWVNGKGKILRILWGINWRASENYGTIYSLKGYEDDPSGLTMIDSGDPPESWNGVKDREYWNYRLATYQLNVETGTLPVSQFFCPYAKYRDLSYMFRGCDLIDAGTYALQNQIKMRSDIETLKARLQAQAANS